MELTIYLILIDGSTKGFPQPENTWMKVQIKITATSFSGGMTIEEAKSIVNKLEFEGGNPDPKGEIEEYQNLTPDDGYAQTASTSDSINRSPEKSASVPTSSGVPDFVKRVSGCIWTWIKGSLTHWDKNSNQWGGWSEISKPKLNGMTSTTSVTEKYQGMEFSEAVESIMNSSKSEAEKKKDLGKYILGF